MDFIQGRIDISEHELACLAELLEDLNGSCRRAFARSIRAKVPSKSLNVPWAMKAGCFADQDGEDLMFTSHQKNMAARKAKGLREAANAKSAWLSGHHAGLAKECGKKLEKAQADLAAAKAALDEPSPFAKESLTRKNQLAAEKIKAAIHNVRGRMQRLKASSEKHAQLAKSGLASMAFGSRKLASQAHLLDREGSALKSKKAWEQAWQEAREQSWLFEGDKSAASANKSVKFDVLAGILRVRLTDRQAEHHMQALASKIGVDPKILSGDSEKHAPQRMQCRQLAMKLDLSGQVDRFAKLRLALTPSTDSKYKGKTPPCDQPVSWRIWIEGDISKPSKCKVYARAQWVAPEVPLITFGSNGCLGVDINAWGAALAWCNPEGNKPAAGQSYFHDMKIDWAGTSNQSLHAIRVAAKAIVDGAAALGSPLCLEALDFGDIRRRLRYEVSPKQAKLLSGFAYQKLLAAILLRAAKVGVEVRWVDPAWTSLVGWAKYGSEFGLNPDQAAAFCIARRGAFSSKHTKRRKIASGWVDLHAKPEKLSGLGSKVGWACKATNVETRELKLKRGEDATMRTGSRGQRSMPSGTPSAERLLAWSLGSNRREWPKKLCSSAKARRLESRISMPETAKGSQAGETKRPAQMKKSGRARISTD